MLGADPGLVGFTPLKEREAGEPEESPLRFVDNAECFTQLQTKLPCDERGGFAAFDLLLGGDRDDEVAGLRPADFRQLLSVFRSYYFLDGGSDAFRSDFDDIRSAGAERLSLFGAFVQVFPRIARRLRRPRRADVAC